KLYEDGLNRQLFQPFIALIKERLDVLNLDGAVDYRLQRMAGMKVYLTPLGPDADRAMDEDWRKLTDEDRGTPMELTVLGRELPVPQAARGVARFSFDDLCKAALAAADYLTIAHTFRTVMIDRIPVMGPEMRNEARRFVLLIETLYTDGDGAEAFRRTASRLAEMRSADYLSRGHKIEMPTADIDLCATCSI